MLIWSFDECLLLTANFQTYKPTPCMRSMSASTAPGCSMPVLLVCVFCNASVITCWQLSWLDRTPLQHGRNGRDFSTPMADVYWGRCIEHLWRFSSATIHTVLWFPAPSVLNAYTHTHMRMHTHTCTTPCLHLVSDFFKETKHSTAITQFTLILY